VPTASGRPTRMTHPSIRHVARLSQSPEQARKTRECARQMLRPLLRVLLAAGIDQRQLVQVCEQVVQQLSSRAVVARITPLLNRKPLEVIVARWASHSAYLDRGKPIRLRLRGKRPSFQELVKTVSAGYSPSLALRNLQRSHVVRIARDRKVELVSRFYPVRSHGAVDIEPFSKMTTDFLRAHEFNLLKNPALGRGLFQRIAHKLNSDSRLAPTFNRYVREQGQLFLETVDEWLVRHQPKRSSLRRKKNVRLGVGIYVINEALR